MTSISEYIKGLTKELESIYDSNESVAISDLYTFDTLEIFGSDKFLRKHDDLNSDELRKLNKNRKRLLCGEPVQYILGYTYFFDLKFKVNNNVLIPRQETEVIVDTIIKRHKTNQDVKILDIGTGSGCIPISIKANLQKAEVFSVDISEAAIQVAKENALINQIDITFTKFDILSNSNFPFDIKFDIIVSNPPYVLESEKDLMHKNVLENEPDGALYVPDKDPLIFYRAILNHAHNLLNKNGKVYFEINETLGLQMIELCESHGFSNTELIKDLNNKDRFIVTYY